ncbi:hypothetical protein [Halosimplex amylolyticum]|uniref:hypothetical protein n=1 Tax=Halosimplex amylolyticum TaxID=3396616 RepID=UPI003F563D28
MASKYDRTFLDHLCDYDRGLRLVFTFSVAVLGLSLVWLYFLDAGSPAYVVTVMNLLGTGVLALLSGLVLRNCD